MEDKIKEALKLTENLLEDLPKVTISQNEKMWVCRNRWALGIKQLLEEIKEDLA